MTVLLIKAKGEREKRKGVTDPAKRVPAFPFTFSLLPFLLFT
jgi:hypothetical protein